MAAYALLRFHIPMCRPLTVQRLLDLLQNPQELDVVNQRRTALTQSLKNYRTTESTGKRSFDLATQQLQEYLADAFGLQKATESFGDAVTVRFEFGWTSSLTKQTDKFYTSDAPQMEIAMVLAAIAFAGMDEASQAMSTGSISEVSRVAGNKLCEMAGIWDYLAAMNIPARQSNDAYQRKPLEVASSFAASALSNACMAQAEEIGALNALARDIKMSLVAKLFLRSNSLYLESEKLFQTTVKGQPEVLRLESQFISDYVIIFLSVKAKFTLALAHKCLAIDVKSKDSHGAAIAHLQYARQLLIEAKDLQKTSSILGSREDNLAILLWRQVCDQETPIQELLEKYTKENDIIYFERVPIVSQLQVPPDTSLFSVKPFAYDPEKITSIDVTLKERQSGCVIS